MIIWVRVWCLPLSLCFGKCLQFKTHPNLRFILKIQNNRQL